MIFHTPLDHDMKKEGKHLKINTSKKFMSSTQNLPLKDLQKIILGSRDEPLSSVEIKNLLSYPVTPETILYLIRALNSKKIDPDSTLIESIASAKKKEDLIPVGLALRYGADPNVYVQVPKIGNIHILGYTYLLHGTNNITVLNAIVIMLVQQGSNPSMPIFDECGDRVRDEFSLLEPTKGLTVLEWLTDQGFYTILPDIRDLDNIDEDFLTLIGTYINRPDLIVSAPKMKDIIQAHSNKVFADLKSIDYIEVLALSIQYLNLTSYKIAHDKGYLPEYYQLDNMILSMKEYKRLGDMISLGQVKTMIIYSVERGMVIDEGQYKIIEELGSNVSSDIEKAYDQPKWKKLCKVTEGPKSDEFLKLVYHLNLDTRLNKAVLCKQIQTISQADPTLVKESAIKRQQVRTSSSLSVISDFITGIPDIKFDNLAVVPTIYDYPDDDIAFYTDINGSHWGFIVNHFQKLLDLNMNPYTSLPLPDQFKDEIENKLNNRKQYTMIQEMGETGITAIPLSATIDDLASRDNISSVSTDRSLKLFDTYAQSNDIISLSKLSKTDMQTILADTLNVNVDLIDLSREQAERSFKVISYQKIERSPDLMSSLADAIKRNI